jgi:hypothetical protein
MSPASVALLIAINFLIQMTDVVFDGRLQHMIASETRATVASVRGVSVELWGILTFLAMGNIVGEGAFRVGFLAFGGVLVCVGLVYTAWMVPLLIPRTPRPESV